jgi:hypothetical protein
MLKSTFLDIYVFTVVTIIMTVFFVMLQVKVMKEYRPPGSAVPSRPAPLKTEKQASPAPAQVADALAFTSNPQSGSFQDPEGII